MQPRHATKTQPVPATTQLFDVQAVAELLRCSPRHVYRLVDAGRMPRPVKLGQLCRWPRRRILDWVDAGCPTVQPTTGRRNHASDCRNGGSNARPARRREQP